jgi:hypothetical protein
MPFFRGGGDDIAPAFLAALDFTAEIIVHQQIHQLGELLS